MAPPITHGHEKNYLVKQYHHFLEVGYSLEDRIYSPELGNLSQVKAPLIKGK